MLNRPAPLSRSAAALLYAPGIAYRAAVRLRNALYDGGYLKTRRLPCPVISIGNLTVGGTGKTPVTSFLAGMLGDSGYRVAILSRGYGRRRGRQPLLVSDGRSLLVEPDHSGDEPYLIARQNPSAAVAVGSDRVAAARLLSTTSPPEVVLLDDAYQHRPLRRDIDILLIDGRDPWGNGRMIPFGPLREPRSSVSRADALVITRDVCPPDVEDLLRQYNPDAALFRVRIEPHRFVTTDGSALDCTALKGFAAFAFSGIARPDRFEDDLRVLGIRLVGVRRFADHHRYRPRELDAIAREARQRGAEILLTTEKDMIRVTSAPEDGLPLYALALRVITQGGADLPAYILDRLRHLTPRPGGSS